MKISITFTLVSLLLISCGTETSETEVVSAETIIDSAYCDCSDLTFDRPYNHFWRFDRQTGFTGICEEFFSNGTVKQTRNLVEGKLHGKVISYYDNGQVREEKEFDMNLQIGEQINYTKKGEVKFHALYKRGVQQQILVNKPGLPEEDPWSAN